MTMAVTTIMEKRKKTRTTNVNATTIMRVTTSVQELATMPTMITIAFELEQEE